MEFKNIITALITPFKGNQIDYFALELLINRQIDAKIGALAIAGSTGEGSSLTSAEYNQLLEASVSISGGRIKIIAAMTAAATNLALEKLESIQKIEGVDGIMCTAPHYTKPEQQGILEHFTVISQNSDLPIMLYLHPGRTGCNISDNTLLALSSLENITALKDASDDFEKPLRILPQIKAGAEFSMLTGDDSRLLAYTANGGSGAVSVTANLFPKLCNKIYSYWQTGNISKAQILQQKLVQFTTVLFTENNPIGAKYASYLMGLCSDEIRLPLTKASAEFAVALKPTLQKLQEVEDNV